VYDSLQLAYIGAHKDSYDEKMNNPKIIEANGLKIAFINFTYGTNGMAAPKPYIVNMMDSTAVKQAIARGKERGANMIIALPHWGVEYQLYPSGKQKEWAKMLFRNGVNIIIGSHPHVPQSAEIYMNDTPHPRKYGAVEKMVFYSLGNYISNQSIPDYTQLEMMVKVYIIKNNLSGEITLGMPEYEYLWCFKKDEFDPDYTVVPVNKLMQDPSMMAKIKSPQQRERMENAFKLIMNKKLVREL
ncbi:MAG: CapA family protein, partial [Bacteroidales bacterium]|nr:CapA family protein [Bacteroidales bacterium]